MMTTTTDTAQLAMDTILRKPVKGIPTWLLNIMEHDHIDRLAGVPQGTYRNNPEPTYLAMQRNIGVCMLDQYIWDNPLSMGSGGYEGATHGATTGADEIILNGMQIDSPEAVVEHMERFVFPALKGWIQAFNEDAQCRLIINQEASIQQSIGATMLKTGYGYITFPVFSYSPYGYVNYFSAYALYPEIIEEHFTLQADLALLNNKAAARAIVEGNLPLLYRLDFDMADSRGTLVNVKSLDKIWFPHFARCLEPILATDMNLIWHCDGNLMEMVPRLLDVGIRGFQGFQYEDGMDYEKICQMKTKEGEELIIIAGVSVTRTLPMGTPADVKREMEFLVKHGPKTGLFLGGSSSVAPGVPWANLETFIEGLHFYQANGRSGF